MPTHDLISYVPLRFKVGSTVDVEQRVSGGITCCDTATFNASPNGNSQSFCVSALLKLNQIMNCINACWILKRFVYMSQTGFQDISIELIAVMNG